MLKKNVDIEEKLKNKLLAQKHSMKSVELQTENNEYLDLKKKYKDLVDKYKKSKHEIENLTEQLKVATESSKMWENR